MKTVFLHGLGQTSHDWQPVLEKAALQDVDCPDLFVDSDKNLTYPDIRLFLEERYAYVTQPIRICGLSLGAILALDYAVRHREKVASLVLIGAQYKVPTRLIDFQNLMFRCMPGKMFRDMGMEKDAMIRLAHSMRLLDFSGRLSEIRCPVAILCGEKDRANLKASKQLKERLPQAQLYIVPGAGHEINKYAPEAIASVLRSEGTADSATDA